eukprot:472201-Rhodomonas_salina.1
MFHHAVRPTRSPPASPGLAEHDVMLKCECPLCCGSMHTRSGAHSPASVSEAGLRAWPCSS